MSVSNSNRDPSGNSPAPVRRPRTDCGDNPPAPRFSHIQSEGKLEVPQDCDASVILKRVDRDAEGHDIYAFWLVVGRYGQGAMAASYKATDGDIRVDIPTGATMSSAALQPHLATFVASPLEGPPPKLFP